MKSTKSKLICMSFDGEFKEESFRLGVGEYRPFDSIEEAWECSNDLGSKWYFYPFHFVTTPSTATIRAAPDRMEILNGWRTKKVIALFERLHVLPEAKNMDAEQFFQFVLDNI